MMRGKIGMKGRSVSLREGRAFYKSALFLERLQPQQREGGPREDRGGDMRETWGRHGGDPAASLRPERPLTQGVPMEDHEIMEI
uniref:Uncharacterized protein n=1 Tax=Knipowitschia caucasica TaxID=637954 RepID=A0AAV2KC82_KNICA